MTHVGEEKAMTTTPEEAYARENTVLLVRTGSQLYGTNLTDTPDNDEMGIFVETMESVFSADSKYQRPGTVTLRTARDDQTGYDLRSGPGDTDCQLLSLNHFMRETAKGNPNTLTILFAPPDKILKRTHWELYYDLADHVGRFITKHLGKRYLGYLDNQRRLYLTGPGANKHRFDLVQAHGFDTKGAYHALRVALQGIEIMSTGHINLPMTPEHVEYLKAVRRGEFSKVQVLNQLAELEGRLGIAVAESDWAEYPDYNLLTQWNYDLHKLYWDYLHRCALVRR